MDLQRLMKVDAAEDLDKMIDSVLDRAQELTDDLPITAGELCQLTTGSKTKVLQKKLVVRLSKYKAEQLYQSYQADQQIDIPLDADHEENSD